MLSMFPVFEIALIILLVQFYYYEPFLNLNVLLPLLLLLKSTQQMEKTFYIYHLFHREFKSREIKSE